MRRRLEEKDATIAGLRLQWDLLGAKKGLERQLQEGQDLDARCKALKSSLAQFIGDGQHLARDGLSDPPATSLDIMYANAQPCTVPIMWRKQKGVHVSDKQQKK